MLKAFIDDSGNDGRSPKTIVAAWSARCDDWEDFVDKKWRPSLAADNPKPLKLDADSQRYVKYYHAKNRSHCFEGFTEKEAQEKVWNLAHLFVDEPVVGFIVSVDNKLHKQIVSDVAITEKSGVRPELADPVAVVLFYLIPAIQYLYHRFGVRDQIDIIVDGDGTDAAERVVLEAFRLAKPKMTQPWYELSGGLSFCSSKSVGPLQAADLLAGDKREATIKNHPSALIQSLRESRVLIPDIELDANQLDVYRAAIHTELSTQRIRKAGKQREVYDGSEKQSGIRGFRQGDRRAVGRSAKRVTKKTRRRKTS